MLIRFSLRILRIRSPVKIERQGRPDEADWSGYGAAPRKLIQRDRKRDIHERSASRCGSSRIRSRFARDGGSIYQSHAPGAMTSSPSLSPLSSDRTCSRTLRICGGKPSPRRSGLTARSRRFVSFVFIPPARHNGYRGGSWQREPARAVCGVPVNLNLSLSLSLSLSFSRARGERSRSVGRVEWLTCLARRETARSSEGNKTLKASHADRERYSAA